MIGQRVSWAGRALVLVTASALAAPVVAQGSASMLDTVKAKAFVGEWLLTIQGAQEGPLLSIKDVGGKVAAELGGGRGGPVIIPDITMPASDLVLKWKRMGRGGEVEVVMTLTLKNRNPATLIPDFALTFRQDVGGNVTTGTGDKIIGIASPN